MLNKIFSSKKITNARIFQGFLYCFLLAVFGELILEWNVWGGYLILLFGLVLFLFGYKKRETLFLFFCLLGLFLGWWKTGGELEKINERLVEKFSGYGYIFDLPEIKEDYQKIIVCPVGLKEKNRKNGQTIIKPDCSEKIIVFDKIQIGYQFGQLIKIDCQLKNPENKEDKFDYVKFLAKDHIYQICQSAKIKKIEEDKYQLDFFYRLKNFIFRYIFKIKNGLETKLNRSFSYPESAYLTGLLLGGEDRLPENIQENFRRTGTTHTIAVSGFNITILAGFFMWLGILVGFYRQKAFWVAVMGVIFFVLMIGSPSSAVRAAIMGILLLWAAKKGRLVDSIQVILLAGALMIFVSPLIMFYDVGFQLSFLASLSIVLVYAPLSEKFNIRSDFLELKSILLVTISAQLGVLGILLYTFETFSPISLLANLLILPWIPVIMLTGFMTVILAFMSSFLSSLFSLPTQFALHSEIWIIEELAKIPWATIEIKNIGIWGLVLYYLAFFVFVKMLRKKIR